MKTLNKFFLMTAIIFAVMISSFVPVFSQDEQEVFENLWVTDESNGIKAIARYGNTIFIGGNLTYVGPNVGYGTAFDMSNGGSRITDMPRVNDDIHAAVSDGNGGWYIGGGFTWVGGIARNYVAHIKADRTVDENFNANATSGTVRSLYLDQTVTPHVLYVGNSGIIYYGGIQRKGIAALNAETGSLITSFVSPFGSTTVYDITVSNSMVYVVTGALYGLNKSNGSITWAISTSGGVAGANEVEIRDELLYVGGWFTTIGGVSQAYCAVVDATTGVVQPINLGITDYATALKVGGSTMYVSFRRGSSAYAIKSFDLTTHQLLWSLTTSQSMGVINSLDITEDGSILFIGSATVIPYGGAPNVRLAALDVATRTIIPTWHPVPNNPVNVVAVSGSNLYAGGAFTSVDGKGRDKLAALDATTGEVLNWNPDLGLGGGTWTPSVEALVAYGSRLYVGGSFSSVNGVIRSNAAAFDLTTLQLTNWNPNIPWGGYSSSPGVY